MNEDEKRLRKIMRKLYRWARKHGYEWLDITVIGPDGTDSRWYTSGTASGPYTEKVSAYKFYDEGSDDD